MNYYLIYIICNVVTFCYTPNMLLRENLTKEEKVLQSIHKGLDRDCVLYAHNLSTIMESNKILKTDWKKILYVEYSPISEKSLTRHEHVYLVWKSSLTNGLFISDEIGTRPIKITEKDLFEIAKISMPNSIIYQAYYLE